MSKSDIATLVAEIIEMGNRMRVAEGFADCLAEPGPPASAKVKKEVLAAIPDLPPSFLALLSIHDGIQNYEWMDVKILSCKELIEKPDLATGYDLEEWGIFQEWGTSGEFDVTRFTNKQLIVFGQSDSDSHLIAFDRAKPCGKGEQGVVHFDSNGFFGVHKDLVAFLRARHAWFVENSPPA